MFAQLLIATVAVAVRIQGEEGSYPSTSTETAAPANYLEDTIADYFVKHDLDFDGLLSAAEVDDKHKDLFEEADADKDGFVTAEEVKALIAKRPELIYNTTGTAA